MDYSAKTLVSGRRELSYAMLSWRESSAGALSGVVRWYGVASAWHPSTPIGRLGPKAV